MTKQLLAFTRKQVLLPQVLDLNDVVTDVNGLLARLIGEDVELRSDLSPRVHPVEADVGQLEQVIVNLAVNARDAMPTGGTLTIATANREISRTDAIARQRDLEGRLVRGALGHGHRRGHGRGDAAPDLRALLHHEGGGQGDGPRPRHGVRDRQAERRSHRGRERAGPRHDVHDLPAAREGGPAGPRAGRSARAGPGGGSETILLVEDEEVVRILEREVLERHGYTVLEAAGPEHATELAALTKASSTCC